MLEWLLRQALSVEYGDDSERYNSSAAGERTAEAATRLQSGGDAKEAEQAGGGNDGAVDSLRRLECGDEQSTRAAAAAVCARLHLPQPDAQLPQPPSTLSLLQSLHALLAYHLALPASASAAATPSSSPSASAVSFLSSLPVGVDSGDGAVNVALAALRLLSVWELKAVQEAMTARLHAAQQKVKRGSAGRPPQQLVDMQRGEVGR